MPVSFKTYLFVYWYNCDYYNFMSALLEDVKSVFLPIAILYGAKL